MADKDLYPREANLGDRDAEAIADAILQAYPNRDFLYVRMAGKWGVRVDIDISSLDAPGKIVVHRIVDFARSEGRLLDLLGLTWSDKPQNPKLKELADLWLPDQAGVLAKYGQEPPPQPSFAVTAEAVQARLEKQVEKHSRLVNLQSFIDKMERLSGALCRVGIPHVNGTGFLIGRRFVLTNYHVVQAADIAATQGKSITCEFDYFKEDAASVTFNGKAGLSWLRLKSPFSMSDITGSGVPSPGELDFALIELANDVEPSREALQLPFAPPIVTQNDYIIIGQHPGGEAAQLALGQVVAYPGGSLRYRYNVTTQAGSSGSPVLDMDLELVALHHAADPAGDPKYNQGVPIARIKEAFTAANVDLGG